MREFVGVHVSDQQPGIGTLVLNREPTNALSRQVYRELAAAAEEVSRRPDIAAVITLRPEGYYLIPIKEGFATHNGNSLTEKTPLKDDDIIGVGGTKFRFFIKKQP